MVMDRNPTGRCDKWKENIINHCFLSEMNQGSHSATLMDILNPQATELPGSRHVPGCGSWNDPLTTTSMLKSLIW